MIGLPLRNEEFARLDAKGSGFELPVGQAFLPVHCLGDYQIRQTGMTVLPALKGFKGETDRNVCPTQPGAPGTVPQ